MKKLKKFEQFINETRTYTVSNIKYDTDGEKVDLPKELKIEIPDDIEEDEIEDYISDEISNRTGFCHLGFVINELD